MTKCLLCLEVVDIVNHDGLCEECLDAEFARLLEQEEYLNYIIEEGEE